MDSKKRQDFPSTSGSISRIPQGLWIVSTPLGNLSDLSDRARAALSQAHVILSEDTRRARALLHALGIENDCLRFDAEVENTSLDSFLRKISDGMSLALITDAGTPAISDPGAKLVRAARAAGHTVIPIVGPSAVTALLSVSGFQMNEFSFHGFFPRETKRQAEMLQSIAPGPVHVFFESPQRISETMSIIENWAKSCEESLGTPIEICAGKELTKLHERFFFGLASQACADVRSHISEVGAIGEWAFAIRRLDADISTTQADEWDAGAAAALECLLIAGVSTKECAKIVSQKFGVTRNDAYDRALKISEQIAKTKKSPA